jgi:predicted nucleic acid-binding protein
MKIAIDSLVPIYALSPDSELHLQAVRLIENAPIAGYELHASDLLYLELLSSPEIKDEEVPVIRDGLAEDLSASWPIDVNIVLKAAELRRKHHFKTPDAIHIATAVERKCDYFVTNDLGLIKKVEIDGVKIVSLKDFTL